MVEPFGLSAVFVLSRGNYLVLVGQRAMGAHCAGAAAAHRCPAYWRCTHTCTESQQTSRMLLLRLLHSRPHSARLIMRTWLLR